MAVRMQLFRFLSLLWGLFFSLATYSGSHRLNSNGPGTIRDGQGDMRWGRKHEECMCVWGGQRTVAQWWCHKQIEHFWGKNDTLGIINHLVMKHPPTGQEMLWQSWGCGSIWTLCLWVYVYFFLKNICISSLCLYTNTHTKTIEKIEEGRPYL